MPQITIDGSPVTVAMSPAEAAGLGAARSRVMAQLQPGPDQSPDTQMSERPGYIGDDIEYLQSVVQSWVSHNSANASDVSACVARCLASWSDAPVDPDVQPEAEPLSPEAQKAALIAWALDRRWRKEVGGVTVNGILVPTDDRAKLLLLGAAQSMADGSSAPLVVAGVNYGLMSKAQFQAINDAVVAHVQATFPVLASVIAGINDGTITSTTEIEGAFA